MLDLRKIGVQLRTNLISYSVALDLKMRDGLKRCTYHCKKTVFIGEIKTKNIKEIWKNSGFKYVHQLASQKYYSNVNLLMRAPLLMKDCILQISCHLPDIQSWETNNLKPLLSVFWEVSYDWFHCNMNKSQYPTGFPWIIFSMNGSYAIWNHAMYSGSACLCKNKSNICQYFKWTESWEEMHSFQLDPYIQQHSAEKIKFLFPVDPNPWSRDIMITL